MNNLYPWLAGVPGGGIVKAATESWRRGSKYEQYYCNDLSTRMVIPRVRIDNGEAMRAFRIIDFSDAQNGGQNFRSDFHRTGLGGGAGFWLRKSGGGRGVKGDVALDFLKEFDGCGR